ncbi:MAG: phosphonate C-P lyase system protein PhnG [Rhodomicrobium sp.]|nr:phosphonate C-P lyase system protein PhnG [Rhodomicrobium sp.]
MTHFTGQDRQRWIGLLSRAAAAEIECFFQDMDGLPPISELRPPETGMVMVRARITGSGAPFNVGEMTVTRCSISALGHTGHALVQGRSPEHARFAALADALLQDEAWFKIFHPNLIERLAQAEAESAGQRMQDANGTKVEFFTMVRGEDEK